MDKLVYYATKAACTRAIREAGYTIFKGEGQCGDYAHGSRLYFEHPQANPNRFGVNMNSATASRTSDGWYASYFGDAALMPEEAK